MTFPEEVLAFCNEVNSELIPPLGDSTYDEQDAALTRIAAMVKVLQQAAQTQFQTSKVR